MSLNEIGARNVQAFVDSTRAKHAFPKQIDDITWVDAIDADGEKVIYSYSLTVTDQAEASRIVEELRRQLPSSVCNQPDMHRVAADGVTFEYRYRMRNGPSYDPITITPKDCRL